MSSFKDVIATARAAWLSNYTLGDKKWRLKQLHGLHRLVVDNRDEIVTALASGRLTFILRNKELTRMTRDLTAYLSLRERNRHSSQGDPQPYLSSTFEDEESKI